MEWIVVAIVLLVATAGIVFAVRRFSGGKYAGMPLNPQADEHELLRWLEVNNMGGFPYWAKKGEGTMWKRWMDEQQALWSRGTPGQGYNTWRREKIAAGVWEYDDE